jgi:hypothetical protein
LKNFNAITNASIADINGPTSISKIVKGVDRKIEVVAV